jgi:signal transduction histidine kinase
MLRKTSAGLYALKNFFSSIVRMPSVIHRSLFPKTESAAQNVQAQLELVCGNVKLLDYALPFVGAVIVFVHSDRAPLSRMGSLLALTVVMCLINELVLLRRWGQEKDLIARATQDARTVSLAAWLLMGAWGFFCLGLWMPPGSDVFALLILSSSLAAVTTMFSAHAASATGAFGALSFFIIVLELMNSINTGSPLITLATVYMAIMGAQSYAIHGRFNKSWQLEQDSEALITNLRMAHEAAVAASRAKSEFLANMSHDLRTPLNAIIGFSDIVRTQAFGNTTEKYSEYGGFIHQSGHHLLDLIGDILDLAKIESGRKVLLQEPVDLGSLVADEVTKAAEIGTEKGITVVSLPTKNLPLLLADPHALRQILENLVSNALKYTLKPGRVEVSAMLNPRHEIELSVTDTGIGIALEMQTHIFERFGSGKPEITTVDRGSGLGLPIVKGLVDMHGGHIALESMPGVGTRVTVIFPASSTLKQSARRVA